MKLITRLAVTGLGLYLLLTTGLLEGLIYLIINSGKFVIELASQEPLGAAIGLLLVITFMGANKEYNIYSSRASYFLGLDPPPLRTSITKNPPKSEPKLYSISNPNRFKPHIKHKGPTMSRKITVAPNPKIPPISNKDFNLFITIRFVMLY